MSGLVRRAGLRHHLRHPGQVALALLGVGLGVAVVVSMDLAMASARESFRASARVLSGRATHRIVGGPGRIPDAVFAAVRLEAGVRASAPVVEGWISSPRAPGRALRLLGVDPFSEGALRPWLAGGPSGFDVSTLVTGPGAAVLAASTARELGIVPGDSLAVTVAGRPGSLLIVGEVEPRDEAARRGLRDLVVMDVSGAQVLLEREGRLSRVDLVVPPGGREEAVLDRIRGVLPPGTSVEAVGTRAGELAEMIRAFDLNLRALSLLALLFGVFLIYNTVTFSVVQRRELLGRLRALGVTRREIFGLVLGEAAVLAVAGSALGLALGTLLARGLLGMVVRTINDLYFVLPADGLAVSPGVLAKGAALGIVATLVAAVPAAAEAVDAPPRATLTRSLLEERARALIPRAAWAGAGLLGVGGMLLLVPSRSVVLAFGSLFALVIGIALTTPQATVLLVGGAVRGFRSVLGLLGTLAARGVAASLSRTGPAVVALVVAVSVTVGLGAMISSFRDTVSAWLRGTLQADVYVSLPGPGASRPPGTIEPGLADRIVGVPGVTGASYYRNVEVDGPGGRVRLVALRLDPRGRDAYRPVEGDPARALSALERGEAALVSEPLAFRRGVAVGDTIRLGTEVGPRTLPVAGVFRDYGSDRGVVVIERALYDRWWSDPGYSSLGLYVADGVAPDTVVRRVERAAGADRSLVVRSNRDLRAASLQVFDRTFAVTGVLRLLAFSVAFIGILGALMALQLERSRELGVLRAQGMTPGQLWGVVTAQTGILGLVSGLLALPAGALLAVVMVHVVNRRSFGWTLDLSFGGDLVAETLLLALSGALLAGLVPAWKMARTSPARALREE